jgi:hypothetical protein
MHHHLHLGVHADLAEVDHMAVGVVARHIIFYLLRINLGSSHL